MRSILFTLLLSLTLRGFVHGQTGTVKLTGQVVCGVERWSEEDRRLVPYGDIFDRDEAARCLAKGGPPQLAVLDAGGRTTFYALVAGEFRPQEKDWLPYVGDTVEVTGTALANAGERRLIVDALRVLMHAVADSEPQWEVVPDDPELALKDLSGAHRRLSDYRGRVVVLNFFATYCVPCRHEMPNLTALQNDYGQKGVQVVGVSADHANDGAKVRQFAKEVKLNFPVWLGAGESDMLRFGLGLTLPGTLIVGRDGRVARRVEGTFNPVELRKEVDALLAQAAERP